MKVKPLVLITTSFPIAVDGSEAAGSFVADLVEELAKSIPVRVVAPGLIAAREQWSDAVEVFRYAAPAQALSTLKPWRLADLRWLNIVLRGGLQATRQAVTGDACHIFALWALPCGEWARKVAKEKSIAYSVWMLGSDIWSLGKIPVIKNILARTIRQAKNAYADGYQLADDAQRIAKAPVQFLPSTRRIETRNTLVPRNKAPYRLLFLGRWHPNKGIDLLLEALIMLRNEDWALIEKVEIQGGGPMEVLVREKVGALQKAGRPVELGQYLSKAEAEQAIARNDWVLIPSRIESIPVIFSDAMKLGRPVITTPVGDLLYLLHNVNCGVLAKSVSALDLAEALRIALKKSARAYEDGTSKQRTIFDMEKIVSDLLVDFNA